MFLEFNKLPQRPRIAEQPLSDFTTADPIVLEESGFDDDARRIIENTRLNLIKIHAEFVTHKGHVADGIFTQELEEIRREDCHFVVRDNALLVIERSDGALIGGISAGTLFIKPEERGRGIARDIHINLQALEFEMLKPSYFSKGGYGARLAAHREACLLDYQAGLSVHPENLIRYSVAIEALNTREASLEP